MSEKCITSPSTKDNAFNPKIIYNYGNRKIRFKGIFLKQASAFFIHRNLLNLYILYFIHGQDN